MFELLSTLIFAAVAVVFAVRLYLVLGRKEGHMEAPAPRREQTASAGDSGGPSLRPAFEGPAAAGLEAIAAGDRNFDPERFVDGAKSAYQMIVEAFARGDKVMLRSLLTETVFERYASAIDARQERGETTRTEIERIRSADITDAEHGDDVARIKVRFDTDIATETTDRDGVRIAGDFGQVSNVREIWSFERPTGSTDPNWALAGVAVT